MHVKPLAAYLIIFHSPPPLPLLLFVTFAVVVHMLGALRVHLRAEEPELPGDRGGHEPDRGAAPRAAQPHALGAVAHLPGTLTVPTAQNLAIC